ncbi:putative ABC transport system permease protein [Arenibacter algicola]|jgi:putative ABC transport system permease protein|uniref:ABC transport system permease protein n=1 Tax=Arenibacter algicola TaxID=616991 RepID=A0A221UWP9_9FLAO|nr:ABC transporter permease [Arenibacter algicola]ASO05752.1 macrolide export ATP-binding/permease protein MacB [Arenibacter algicola]MDX1758116.1 ABC transporter permease [Arenibacter algicola]|tara:strand:- start:295 stop:1524 length:1230 start_codon:yes stop_codon:yes gene_type:complete
MFSRDNWKEIFETIHKNKLRTFLSGFTVALGILIFVVLFGMGNGLVNTFNEFFGDDATNVLYVFPGRTTIPYKGYKSNRTIEFDNSDLVDINKNFAMFVEYSTPRISRGGLVKYRNESNNYTTRAVGPSHQYAEKTIMMKGRFINEEDVKNKTKYVVIGRLVEQDLFGNNSAIGEYIDVAGSAFMVIGVFQDDGGDNEERLIYMPYTTRQLIEKNNDKIDQIIVAFKPEIGYAGAMALDRSLDRFFREKKYISPDDQNGVFIRNVADQLKQNQQFARVLQIIVALVAFGTIIAGIIGISNIMVFVVKERTKELGIRKALGATPKSVIGSILLESVFITTISGFFGMLLGIFILNSLGEKLKDYFITNPYIDITMAISATLVLILFGAIAGYIPAKRAAEIKPIEALRDE